MNSHVEIITSSHAFSALWKDCTSGRCKHAYAFTSRDFYALETLARLFICLAEKGTVDELMYRRLESGGYTDVIKLPREGKNGKMDVEEVSFLTDTAYFMPTELNCKYYIIAPEEPMSTAVQNKMLKTLEEPPSSVRFIIFDRGNDLLSTVASRCSPVKLEEFTPEQIRTALVADGIEETKAVFAAAVSHGALGSAYKMISDGSYMLAYERAANFLLNVRRSPQILPTAAEVIADKDSLGVFIDYLEILLRDAMAYQARGAEGVILKPALGDVRAISREYNTTVVLAVMPLLTRARERNRLYGNISSIVDELLFSILEVKAKCPK